jgi:hypothetical protein
MIFDLRVMISHADSHNVSHPKANLRGINAQKYYKFHLIQNERIEKHTPY